MTQQDVATSQGVDPAWLGDFVGRSPSGGTATPRTPVRWTRPGLRRPASPSRSTARTSTSTSTTRWPGCGSCSTWPPSCASSACFRPSAGHRNASSRRSQMCAASCPGAGRATACVHGGNAQLEPSSGRPKPTAQLDHISLCTSPKSAGRGQPARWAATRAEPTRLLPVSPARSGPRDRQRRRSGSLGGHRRRGTHTCCPHRTRAAAPVANIRCCRRETVRQPARTRFRWRSAPACPRTGPSSMP